MDNAHQQNDRADEHNHSLQRIVQHAGAESTKRSIQRDAYPEDNQARLVRDSGRRFQQACSADKLYGHRTDKGHQQAQARQPHQQAALIAGIQHIVERHGIITARQNSKFFAQYAQRKPDGRQLDHSQQYPA